MGKVYYAVTRGWVPESGVIDRPLKGDGPATTEYRRVGRVELSEAVGKYATARYSLVRVSPLTGRMHQIRRHFARAGHPLLGDRLYGDKAHNRFFAEKTGCTELWLKAYALELRHPATGAPLRIVSRWNDRWHRVFGLFGVCPYGD